MREAVTSVLARAGINAAHTSFHRVDSHYLVDTVSHPWGSFAERLGKQEGNANGPLFAEHNIGRCTPITESTARKRRSSALR